MLTIYTRNTNNSFILRRFGQMDLRYGYHLQQVYKWCITYDLIFCDVQSFIDIIDKIFL